MKNYWWKILAAILVFYSIAYGLIGPVPQQNILYETIRNLYFHVPMWFAMIIMMLISLVYSLKTLGSNNPRSDMQAVTFAHTGMVFSILGLITGMVWAQFTWGKFWTNDPKLNGTAITILIYLAYFVLRGSIEDEQKRSRISAVYNIFAFVLMIVFIGVLPRLTDSLHPGNGGNPGFNQYDLDSNMRMVFYPAVLGWILVGVWISNLKIRYKQVLLQLERKINRGY